MSEFSDKIPLGFGKFSVTHPKSLVDNLMIKNYHEIFRDC
jgi:hypothetical protein